MREADWFAWLLTKPGVGSAQLRQLRSWYQRRSIAWREVARGETHAPVPAALRAWLHRTSEPEVQLTVRKWGHAGVQYVAWFESSYPPCLRMVPDRPAVLFSQSNCFVGKDWGTLTTHSVAVVGTRRLSYYGESVTAQLVEQLTLYGIPVVSGLALGIDTVAHRACLKQQSPTIAVVAGPLDQGFPQQNNHLRNEIIQQGVVCAEFPPGRVDLFHRGAFPMRNRLIAGLSRAVVVAEAPLHSGAIVTARLAQSYSRDLFVLPSDLDRQTNAGALLLAERGEAGVVTSGHAVVAQLNWAELQQVYAQRKQELLNRRLTDCLTPYCPLPIPSITFNQTVESFLTEACQVPLNRLPLVLLKLKMYGIISRTVHGSFQWQLI